MFKEAADANSNPRTCPRLQPKTHSFELLSQLGVEGLTRRAHPLGWNELLPIPRCSLSFAGAQDLAHFVQNQPLVSGACDPSPQGEMEADAKLPPGAIFFFFLQLNYNRLETAGAFLSY